MGAITFKHRGHFEKTTLFLKRAKRQEFYKILDRYGEEGVRALSSATPIDSGQTAQSWHYRIEKTRETVSIVWYNTNVNKGVNIALILQYGHGTVDGHYVRGRNYIKPAIRPVIDEIEKAVWREVTAK